MKWHPKKSENMFKLTLFSEICLVSFSFGDCKRACRWVSCCPISFSISCFWSIHFMLSESMCLNCCWRISTPCWVLSHWFFTLSTEKYKEKEIYHTQSFCWYYQSVVKQFKNHQANHGTWMCSYIQSLTVSSISLFMKNHCYAWYFAVYESREWKREVKTGV